MYNAYKYINKYVYLYIYIFARMYILIDIRIHEASRVQDAMISATGLLG